MGKRRQAIGKRRQEEAGGRRTGKRRHARALLQRMQREVNLKGRAEAEELKGRELKGRA